MANLEPVEITALNENLDFITDSVTNNLQWFANNLVQRKSIPRRKSREILGLTGVTTSRQVSLLMDDVYTIIRNTDSKRKWFNTFIDIFSRDLAHNELVEKLNRSVRKRDDAVVLHREPNTRGANSMYPPTNHTPKSPVLISVINEGKLVSLLAAGLVAVVAVVVCGQYGTEHVVSPPTQTTATSLTVSSLASIEPLPSATLSPAISEYADYLRKLYATYLGSVPDKLPFTFGKEYVTLTLVKNEKQTQTKADEFIQTQSSGNVTKILSEREEIKVEDILTKGEKTHFVLIEGEPDIGKSTLTIELCHQWQNGSLLQQFSLVLLLRLREEYLQTARDLKDLFFHSEEEIRDAVVKKIKHNSGEGVLFIFDGFDEFQAELQKKSVVMDIIRDPKYLPAATVLVTSRPSAVAGLQPLLALTSSKQIHIAGFTNESIHNAAFTALGNPELFSNFSTYLSTNLVVKAIMYNPLHCSIILNMYRENFQTGRPIPHTLTQLYTELSRSLISSYLTAAGDPWARALPRDLKNFPEELHSQLLAVGELAYNGAVIGNKELFDEVPGNTTGLGLLIKHHSLFSVNEAVRYNFFHKSLQEYMAAFYISQQDIEYQRKFVDKYLMSNDLTLVITFLAGLTNLINNIPWESLDPVMRKHTILPTCFYEAHSDKNCSVFGQECELQVYDDKFNKFTLYDMYAVGYTISVCEGSWTLDLLLKTVTKLEMLSYGLKYNQHSNGSIHILTLRGSSAIIETNQLLQIPGPIIQKIEYLQLINCEISIKGFQNLAMCIPELHSLKTLKIDDNPGVPGSLVALMEALKTHGKLETFTMYTPNLGIKDISALLAIMKSSKNLTRLEVGSWPTSTPEIEREMVKTVLLPSSVKHVTIYALKESILGSIEVVSNNLESLTLWDMSWRQEPSTDNAIRLCTALGENTSLKHLNLRIQFNQQELENILLWLKENNNLKTLKLLREMRKLIPESEEMDPRISFKPFLNI